MHVALRALLVLCSLTIALGMLSMSPAAFAQQSEQVAVTAGISSAMAITVCDTTADFGDGLTALGNTPTGTTDSVRPSLRGNRTLGQGTIYIWIPTCAPGQQFLMIESTIDWQAHICATVNAGSSSLSVAQGDLKYGAGDFSEGTRTYTYLDQGLFPFGSCQSVSGVFTRQAGFYTFPMAYTLRVDLIDSPGSFVSTTTWMISA